MIILIRITIIFIKMPLLYESTALGWSLARIYLEPVLLIHYIVITSAKYLFGNKK